MNGEGDGVKVNGEASHVNGDDNVNGDLSHVNGDVHMNGDPSVADEDLEVTNGGDNQLNGSAGDTEQEGDKSEITKDMVTLSENGAMDENLNNAEKSDAETEQKVKGELGGGDNTGQNGNAEVKLDDVVIAEVKSAEKANDKVKASPSQPPAFHFDDISIRGNL